MKSCRVAVQRNEALGRRGVQNSPRAGGDETCPFVYGPATLKIMSTSFDVGCKTLSANALNAESGRRALALRIIIHVDRGERNPKRLARLAADDVLRNRRSIR